jgi:hypothetical protein
LLALSIVEFYRIAVHIIAAATRCCRAFSSKTSAETSRIRIPALIVISVAVSRNAVLLSQPQQAKSFAPILEEVRDRAVCLTRLELAPLVVEISCVTRSHLADPVVNRIIIRILRLIDSLTLARYSDHLAPGRFSVCVER